MLRRFFYESVSSSEYIGGLALALLVWMPFVYFYKNQQLPEWLSKDPNKAIGLAVPMFYIGTSVIEMNHWFTASMSIALLIYLAFNKSLQKDRKLTITLLSIHIFMSIINTVRSLIKNGGMRGRTFDLMTILKNIFMPQIDSTYVFRYNHPFTVSFTIVGIVLGVVIVCIYLYRLIKSKSLNITEYYYFAGIGCALATIFVTRGILNADADTIIYVLWCLEFSLFAKFYENRNIIATITMPTICLILVLSGLRVFDVSVKPLLVNNYDYKWIAKFKEAQANNLDEVTITPEEILLYRIPVPLDNDAWITDYHFNGGISRWMHSYRYTDKQIPIRIVLDEDN